jgi:uncharacterized protein (DUF362 family)
MHVAPSHSNSLRSPGLLADPGVSLAACTATTYPRQAPFDPPQAYPELAGLGLTDRLDPENAVYAAVRASFCLLGLDAAHQDTADWNPLGDVVQPGDRVLIKPNWVKESHNRNDSWEQIITHGAVIRPVIDYLQRALAGRGRITLADGPILYADFAEIGRRSGAAALCDWYRNRPGLLPVERIDLRTLRFETRDAVVIKRHELPGDPEGGVVVDLGTKSALYQFRGEGRYYGADYDTVEVNRHHRGDLHEYQLSGSALHSDVIIDVPKLKTHQKVGVTLALKGVVGLNCGRNWLPHRTQGTPEQGGDQFASSGFRHVLESRVVTTFEVASLRFPRAAPQLYRLAKRLGKRIFGESHETIRGGSWHGNDTLWRMVHDINRALMYANGEGRLQSDLFRRRFVVVDGIVAGEGFGPVGADPVACGVVIAGCNPVAVDTVATELMGFDFSRVPMLAQAYQPHDLPLVQFAPEAIVIASNRPEWQGDLAALRRANPFQFAASLGWDSYLERGEVVSS